MSPLLGIIYLLAMVTYAISFMALFLGCYRDAQTVWRFSPVTYKDVWASISSRPKWVATLLVSGAAFMLMSYLI